MFIKEVFLNNNIIKLEKQTQVTQKDERSENTSKWSR